MKVKKDIKTIGEHGYDRYLNRTDYGKSEPIVGGSQRYLKGQNITSGRMSNQGFLKWGSDQLQSDPKRIQHLVFDGQTARVLIGKFESS